MAKLDYSKLLKEIYPNLNFDSSLELNLSLEDCETGVIAHHLKSMSVYIAIWEYGYYFISLAIVKHSSIHKSYSLIAALITEVHSSLRGSFLLNIRGYHSDAIALLRKTHESMIRALACKAKSQNSWNIIMSSSIRKSEHSIGIDWKHIYAIESSFTHSNRLKVSKAGSELHAGKEDIAISYGPQMDESEFKFGASSSIFWLYICIYSLPKLFPDQISEFWISKQHYVLVMLKDYLESSGSNLTIDIDNFIEKGRF